MSTLLLKVLPSLLVLLFVPLSALAGPPFITDDPEPVERHHWEFNNAVTLTHDQSGTTGSAPNVDVNYGVMPGVQLHVQPQLAYASAPGLRSFGAGDSEFGVKWRLTPGADGGEGDGAAAGKGDDNGAVAMPGDVGETAGSGGWMISLYPLLDVPTGDAKRNLGAGVTSVFLPVWFQRTFGRWTAYGGGGYRRTQGSDNRNTWAGGWVMLYAFSEGLSLGGEVYGNTAATSGGRASVGFNLGGSLALASDYNLLFSAWRGLRNVAATNQASVYLALQVLR